MWLPLCSGGWRDRICDTLYSIRSLYWRRNSSRWGNLLSEISVRRAPVTICVHSFCISLDSRSSINPTMVEFLISSSFPRSLQSMSAFSTIFIKCNVCILSPSRHSSMPFMSDMMLSTSFPLLPYLRSRRSQIFSISSPRFSTSKHTSSDKWGRSANAISWGLAQRLHVFFEFRFKFRVLSHVARKLTKSYLF